MSELPPPLERDDVQQHMSNQGLPTPRTLDDFDFQRTLDAVEDVGVDNTGGSPVQSAIRNACTSGTKIEFPDGTYRLSSILNIHNRNNYALVGKEGHRPVFEVDSGITGNVLTFTGGSSTYNCGLKNFVIDQSASNCSAQTNFNYATGGVVQDVEFRGYSDPDNSGKKLVSQAVSSSGSGLVERVVMTDGTEVGRQGVNHNNTHKQQYDGGMWMGPPHEGTVYIFDCHVSNWSDNGLYASRTNGGIVVAGGSYMNSSISQVRLSHEDSFVGGGVWIEIDRDKIPSQNNPSGLASTRGIWLEPGHIYGNQPPVVGDCHLRMGSSHPNIPGMINAGRPQGNVRLPGPIDMEIQGSARAIYARTPDGRQSSPPPTPHWFRIENLTITGNGSGSRWLVDIHDRPGSYVRNSCIQHTGSGASGVRFAGSSGEVSDSTINVSGSTTSGASTSNVSTSGSCDLREPGDPPSIRSPTAPLSVFAEDDESGQRINGAEVTVEWLEDNPHEDDDPGPWTGTTQAGVGNGGGVELGNIPQGYHHITVEADDYETGTYDERYWRDNVSEVEHEALYLDSSGRQPIIHLDPEEPDPEPSTYEARVRVEDESGNPISHAIIYIDGNEYEANSSGEAHRKLENGTYNISAEARGYHGESGTIEIDDDDALETLVLEEAYYDLTVTVEDSEDVTPIEGATVTIDGNGETTDSDGVATHTLRGGESYNVVATAPGYESNGTTVDIEDDDKSITIQLDPEDETYRVTIRVKDEDGDPIEDAGVSFFDADLHEDVFFEDDFVIEEFDEFHRTDSNGVVQENFRDGEYLVQVSHISYDTVERYFTVDGSDKDIDIEMTETTPIPSPGIPTRGDSDPFINRSQELPVPGREYPEEDPEGRWYSELILAAMEELSQNIAIADHESMRSEYEPIEHQLYISTDGGGWYLGDGTQWVELQNSPSVILS